MRELALARHGGDGRPPQSSDWARVNPLRNVRLQPRDGVFAEPPAFRELAGQLQTIDRHPRQPGELHHVANAKKSHGASLMGSRAELRPVLIVFFAEQQVTLRIERSYLLAQVARQRELQPPATSSEVIRAGMLHTRSLAEAVSERVGKSHNRRR